MFVVPAPDLLLHLLTSTLVIFSSEKVSRPSLTMESEMGRELCYPAHTILNQPDKTIGSIRGVLRDDFV